METIEGGAAAAAGRLAPLRTQGFARLAVSVVLGGTERKAIEEWALTRAQDGPVVKLFEQPHGWLRDLGDGSCGGVTALAQRLLAVLRLALPEERLELESAELRVTRGRHERGDFLHADQNYLTATVALEGPGTEVYALDEAAGTAERVPGADDDVVFITGIERERGRGIAATVHSTPGGGSERRILLVLRYKDPVLPYSSAAIREVQGRADARVAFAEKSRKR